MSLKTDEVIVIAAGAGLLLFWLILASTLSKFRSPSVSLLILLILGSLGAVFYGIHEDKSNLWWIIPTVVIGLCLVGVVYLVSRRRKGTKFEDPSTKSSQIGCCSDRMNRLKATPGILKMPRAQQELLSDQN
jgi:H+/Cl- antiporter ClcA